MREMEYAQVICRQSVVFKAIFADYQTLAAAICSIIAGPAEIFRVLYRNDPNERTTGQ
jgi:hypothetical protein